MIEEAGLDDTRSKRKELVVLLMTDKGELRRIRAQHLDAVRPTNKALAQRIDAALDALTSRASQRRKDISILGNSTGPVTLGYVAETPIWRSSYRLMLRPTGARATLQGWSLIHNDTHEAWKNVTVELVNGQPDSFPVSAGRATLRASPAR